MGLFSLSISHCVAGAQYVTKDEKYTLHLCQHNYGYVKAFREDFLAEGYFDKLLIGLTLSGSGEIILNGQSQMFSQGQVFVLDCRNDITMRAIRSHNWSFKWLHLSGAAYDDFAESVNNGGLKNIQVSDSLALESWFDLIERSILHGDSLTDLKLIVYVNNILDELISSRRVSNSRHSVTRTQKIIEQAKRFIIDNFDKPLTNREIAETVFLSEYHFIRQFKRYAGVSPYEFLINYRLNKARNIVMETDLPIGEIAKRMGFNRNDSMTRCFRLKWNKTPMQLRAEARKKTSSK